jgi:hypothetical protein
MVADVLLLNKIDLVPHDVLESSLSALRSASIILGVDCAGTSIPARKCSLPLGVGVYMRHNYHLM